MKKVIQVKWFKLVWYTWLSGFDRLESTKYLNIRKKCYYKIERLDIFSVNGLSLLYSLLPLRKKSWSFWTPRAQWPGWGKRSLSMSYWIFWKPWVKTILSQSTVSPKPPDPLLNVSLVKMMKGWSVRNWCRYTLLYSIFHFSEFI